MQEFGAFYLSIKVLCIGALLVIIVYYSLSLFRHGTRRNVISRLNLIGSHREITDKRGAKENRPRQAYIEISSWISRQSWLLRIFESEIERSRHSLGLAGIRAKESAILFLLFRYLLPIFSFLIGVLLFEYFQKIHGVMVSHKVVLGAALPILVLPDLMLFYSIRQRRRCLERNLPEALEMLILCSEAGLGLDAALDRVSRQLRQSARALADELAATVAELNLLPDRHGALSNLAKRTGLPAYRTLVGTLLQAEKFGTPVSQALRALVEDYRSCRLLRAEEKAAQLPALLMLPTILLIFPSLFLVILGPALLRTYDLLLAR